MNNQKDLSRAYLLRKSRERAFDALSHYEIGKAFTLKFIGISDNITYRVNTPSSCTYLLRMNRNERLDKDEIDSELVWLGYLRDKGIVVPEGIKNIDGAYVTEVRRGAHQGTMKCTLMKWVEGQLCGEEAGDGEIRKIGTLMARLHACAEEFKPDSGFRRPIWGVQSLAEDMDKLKGNFQGFMSFDGFKQFQSAFDKICPYIEGLKVAPDTFGMIHADLHMDNVVFCDCEARAIDFGRCGYGYFLYDIAESLLGIMPSDRRVFLDGYKSYRELPENFIEITEAFFIMACIENVSFHSSDPREREDLIRQVPFVLKLIEQYLSGKPFLFGISK